MGARPWRALAVLANIRCQNRLRLRGRASTGKARIDALAWDQHYTMKAKAYLSINPADMPPEILRTGFAAATPDIGPRPDQRPIHSSSYLPWLLGKYCRPHFPS